MGRRGKRGRKMEEEWEGWRKGEGGRKEGRENCSRGVKLVTWKGRHELACIIILSKATLSPKPCQYIQSYITTALTHNPQPVPCLRIWVNVHTHTHKIAPKQWYAIVQPVCIDIL